MARRWSCVRRERAVVREHQAADVAGDERDDLDGPDHPGRQQRVVHRDRRGPEDVRAVAERVGGERGERLALEGDEREVVRDDVGDRDRHERVREARAEHRALGAAAHPHHPADADAVDAGDDRERDREADRAGEFGPDRRADAEVAPRVAEARDDLRPQRPAAEAVVRGRPDQGDEDGDRARAGGQRREAGQRRAQRDAAVLDDDRRGVRQDVRVDRERVGVAAPRDDAVARHPGELDRAVGEDHGAERARVVAADPDELHPADHDEADGGGPAPDALRVRARRRAARGPARGTRRRRGAAIVRHGSSAV